MHASRRQNAAKRGDHFHPVVHMRRTKANRRPPKVPQLRTWVDQTFPSSLFHNAVFETDFKSGLFIPDEFSASSGILEVTAFSTRIFLSNPENAGIAPTANINTKRVSPGIQFRDIYLDERSRDDILFQLHNPTHASPETYTRVNLKEIKGASATPERSAKATTDTKPETTNAQPDVKASEVDDPYELKGRSDGVYILYKTAERCSQTQAFVNIKKAGERYTVATTIFNQLLDEMAQGSDDDNERQKKLRSLLRDTRLGLALKLISPTYVHGSGVAGKVRREEWPPAMGKALLAEPDERRQKFVTDMLAIILRGVQYWSDYDGKVADGVTKQELLKQWLEDHGVTGVGELTTAFTLIAWNGNGSIPTPPKSAAR